MSNHLGFVMAAYGITTVALVLTVGWIFVDQRIQKNELKRLESEGVRRRSSKAPVQ